MTLDQNGCVYVPHVQGIMVGQPYRILNSDGILHNVHSLPKVNPSFNKPMPPTLKETTTTFAKPEPVFQIKCDVHPWMSAYIGVFTHPVLRGNEERTGSSRSRVSTRGPTRSPPGTSGSGTQTATITVGANETKSQNFKFTSPVK